MQQHNTPDQDGQALLGRNLELAHTLAITVHRDENRARGRRVALVGGEGLLARLTPEERLVLELEQLTDYGAWWSQSVYRGNHRSLANLMFSSASVADIDFHKDGKHAPVPPDTRALVDSAIDSAPAGIFHHSPRGFRLIDVFEDPVADQDVLRLVQMDLIEDVTAWLETSGLAAAGLAVDAPATKDLARYFWAPCAKVEGVQRHAILHRIGGAS